MPTSYRYVILAAFGWIILAASPSGQQRHPEQPRTHREIAASLNSIAASLDKANKAEGETFDCPEGTGKRQSGLCAAWKSADAGAESAKAAWASFYLGIFGAALGAITMCAAIAAAIFAKKAADETLRGANAAEGSLSANRAWLSFDRIDSGFSQGALVLGEYVERGIMVRGSFENTGNSPAINLTVYFDHAVLPKDAPIPSFVVQKQTVPQFASVGARKLCYSTWHGLNQADSDNVFAETHVVYVYFRAEYYDTFTPGVRRHTEVCSLFMKNGQILAPDGSIQINFDDIVVGSQNVTV